MFNFQTVALESFILCSEHKGEDSESNSDEITKNTS
jgi:hypothetical protein